MAVIDQIISISIAITSATPALPGVSIPAIIGYHNYWSQPVKTFFDLTDLVAAGVPADSPIYLQALSLVSQNPRPESFKVIKGNTAAAQSFSFKVTAAPPTGSSVGLDLTGPTGVLNETFRHTVTAGQTAAQVATALAAIVIAGLTIAIDGGDPTKVNVTVTAAGDIWYPSDLYWGTLLMGSAAANPGTDLDAAVAYDPDFYGVSGTWLDATNILALAVWCEANKRQHCYTTPDTNNVDTNNAGIFQTLETAAYNYSYGFYSGTPKAYLGTGLMSKQYARAPGSSTAAYNTVAGVPVDGLTPTQITNAGQLITVPTKNGNVYITIAAVNCTVDGRAADGMFFDTRRGIDALIRDIQVSVFGLIYRASNSAQGKVPYTTPGVAAVGAEIFAALSRFVTVGFLSNDDGFQPAVQLPTVASQGASDKQNRILRNVKFTGTLAGAIQKVIGIVGNVSY